jgi:hypothetical protein
MESYQITKENNMKNILNQEVKKPVYLLNKEECISLALNGDVRIREIAKHFYSLTKELLSSYA